MRSDVALLKAARSLDTRAFEELWQRHLVTARGVARATSARVDPEDVASEAFRPYLLTVVVNTARTVGRAGPP